MDCAFYVTSNNILLKLISQRFSVFFFLSLIVLHLQIAVPFYPLKDVYILLSTLSTVS